MILRQACDSEADGSQQSGQISKLETQVTIIFLKDQSMSTIDRDKENCTTVEHNAQEQ